MTTDIQEVKDVPLNKIPNKTTIQNRRLRYINLTDYVSSPVVQERLFPILYEKLILRHKSQTEKLDAIKTSKARTLTNVLLDAGDHMEKIQQQRDRTDEDRAKDLARYEQEQAVAEMTPKRVLTDKVKSRELLEKMVLEKFLAGGDDEFDYESVDEDEKWDDWETLEEDIRAKYFDEETPEEEEKDLTGQTGVQDF
jgi:hypothetical protein